MKKLSKQILRFVILVAASFVYAVGVSLFLDPNNIAPGGVTGIAILMNRLISVISTGTWILILNVPILLLGIWKLGLRLVSSTIYVLIWISFFTNILSTYLYPLSNDRLIASLLGGGLVAVGIGVSFRLSATTGGIDIIVKILRRKYKHLKTGSIFLSIDCVIVALAGIVFGTMEAAGYAMISVFISSYVMDLILYGQDEAKLIFVMSTKAECIAGRMMQELHVGVTYLEGCGAYQGTGKYIVMCAIRKQAAPKAIAIVQSVDEGAFLIITSANEIFGEGYKSYKQSLME